MSVPVSVVVNTYNRADSLRRTLRSLAQLDYPRFEVVVVNGPSTDRTEAVLDEFRGRVVAVRCEERNLSRSRNLGIAHAAGDVVAFIDDDAYPDPRWLDDLVAGFADDEVAAVGGPVYDHTGTTFQARYSVATRFAEAWVEDTVNPTRYLARPLGRTFPYTIGTNAAFRRDRLVEIGGFDEQFNYYLDETDVCCRLLDRGYLVNLIDRAFVYHKFLASDVRTPSRGIRNRFSIVRNIVYFALRHGMPVSSFQEVCRSLLKTMEANDKDYRWSVENGYLTWPDYAQYVDDVPRAFDAGLEAWRSGPRLAGREALRAPSRSFVPFPTRLAAAEKLHVCLFTEEYPPVRLNGIARVIHTLATGLAADGHVVHALTRSATHSTVDLEDGVWVHRVAVTSRPRPAGGEDVPQHLWDYSASLLAELREIHCRRPVDVVQAPNWNSEGIAVLLAGGFTTVVGLYTPLRTLTAVDPRIREDDPVIARMIELERLAYQRADGLLACGPGIVEEVQVQYGIALDQGRVGFSAHGLPDAGGGAEPESPDGDGTVNLLFVGRLEPRKGIDTLLAGLPGLLEEFPRLTVTIVGDDSIVAPAGATYRQQFEAAHRSRPWADRVEFTGPVGDDELGRRYGACDVFVAPSRYESFGLILVEAMMRCKPVIGCDIGGMREIVDVGENGFLVPPGDAEALRRRIAELVASPELRARFGRRGRELYEERYTVERMVQNITRYYRRLVGTRKADAEVDEGELTVISAPKPSEAEGRGAVVVASAPRSVGAAAAVEPAGDVEPDGAAEPADSSEFGERTPENIRRLALGREWFHRIDLGHDVVSPGIDDSPSKLTRLRFPDRFTGCSVLDIGSYDGFFAFEAERRGADRVVAADYFCWNLAGMADGRGFDIAHWALDSRVEKRVIQVEDISPETVGTFDYVFFLGVLYHAPDPLRYLRNVYSVCSRTAIVETHVDGLDYERPMMVFYPGATLNGDPSNFWGPNLACVREMLTEVGFQRVEMMGHYGDRAIFHAHR